MIDSLPSIQKGSLGLSPCHDIGHSIDLERAASALRNPAERRRRPVRVRQTLAVEVTEGIENAIKFTEHVSWNRISAMLEPLWVAGWPSGAAAWTASWPCCARPMPCCITRRMPNGPPPWSGPSSC